MRESLEQVQEQTGKTPHLLQDEPEIPDAAFHVWCWYCDIKSTGAFSYSEIDAWARLLGTSPRPWEIEALRRIYAVMESPHGR